MSEDQALELALRSILRLFADGKLVYRGRDARLAMDVASISRRVRSVRGRAA